MERRAARTRRGFLRGSLASAGLGLLVGCGVLPQVRQPTRVPRLGYLVLNSLSPPSLTAGLAEAFRQRLRELGHVEGQTLAIDWRSAEGRVERLLDLAAELVQLRPDVIFAGGGIEPVQAAQRATSSVPVVFVIGDDPVGAGLVASLARPGGNATGLVSLNADLDAKRVQLLKEAIPGLSRLAVLSNPDDPAAAAMARAADIGAGASGVQLQVVEVRDPAAGLGAAFESARQGRAEALAVLGAPTFFAFQARIAELAVAQRLPAISGWRPLPEAGGLMSYGTNLEDLFRRAAGHVDRILKGTKPADLPVELPTKFDLVINLKAAEALRLTIPQSVLAQATEIIQ
jgi:putative ABC transport system substrate-binding protein